MRAAEALRAAIPKLREAGIATPEVDARRLMAHALCVSPDRLTLVLQDAMTGRQVEDFGRFVAARAARQPVSQIVGERLFYGLSFHVTRDVLDPRPETELLVAAVLEQPVSRMLDLGTGSGCILLSCLAHLPEAVGDGVDLSEAALAVARMNAQRLDLTGRVSLWRSDWFSHVTKTYDLIVSNPPYITGDDLTTLAPEVRDWEPHMALSPGGDGLGAYRAIADKALAHLAPDGRIIVETGPGQAGPVGELLAAAGFAAIEVRNDLDQRARIVCAMRPAHQPGQLD